MRLFVEAAWGRAMPPLARKSDNFVFAGPNDRNGVWYQTDRFSFRRDQARSKRSWFITLVQAAMKSFTNFCCESAQA